MILSILIPARNEFPNVVHTFYSLVHCLEADGFTPQDYEIIILDNCSTDRKMPQRGTGGTTDYLMTRGAFFNRNLRVLYDPIAGNHSARNKGARVAQGEYIFISDAHMAYKPGFFKSMLQTCKESGGLVHGALQFMGAYPPTDSGAGFGYTIKLGEEIKGCVDEETEILTKKGWKKWNEVNMESEFATVKMDTHEIEFQKPKDLVVREHSGKMVKITGRSYDTLLTPYHRTIYSTTKDNKWNIKQAEDISLYDRLPLNTNGIVSKDNLYTDELVELVGWIITEGSYYKKQGEERITITQYNKENNNRITHLAKQFGYAFHKNKRGDICIAQNGSREIFRILPNKELTFGFINKLNRIQLEKLYNVMISGDGTHNNNGHESFIQVNQNTIDAFQYLCILIGKQSKWYTKKYSKNHFGKQDIQVVSIKKNKYVSNFKKDFVDYKGIVWCPELENGTIFCRRNGHTYPSAQTWNNYKISDKWFYVPAQGHWGLMANRKQFLDFGGYPDVHRTYGGGEFYTDMKWWLFGSCVVTDPNAVGYHLASGRGYSYNHDDYLENVLGIGYALGMDDWRERMYINLLRKSRKDVLDKMMERSAREHQSNREFIESRRKMSFNELLIERPWEKKNIERCGSGLSNLLIYQDTIIELFKKVPQSWEAYQNSKYQVELEKFIKENLSQFVYKGK
jgi:glycosyltransferase involved in cell wall biosynthesis